MADLVPKQLAAPTLLTNASTLVYAPGASTGVIRNIIVNPARIASTHVWLSIGADASGTRIYDSKVVSTSPKILRDCWIVVPPGQGLYAHTDTALTDVQQRLDTFGQADSTTTLNPPTDGLAGWTVTSPGPLWGISTFAGYANLGAYTGGSAVHSYAWLEAGASNGWVEVKVSTAGTGTAQYGLIGRYADDNNMIRFRYDVSGAWHLEKIVGGAVTALGNGSQGSGPNLVNNDVIRLSIDATNTMTLTQNGTPVLPNGGSCVDGAGSTNTKWGLYNFCSSQGDCPHFKNFQIQATVSPIFAAWGYEY